MILALGILFGSVWLGPVAALNTLRLRLPLPWWRPLLQAGVLLALGSINLWLEWTLLAALMLLLQLATLVLIAVFDLWPQFLAYRKWRAGSGRPAFWGWLVGSGLAWTACVFVLAALAEPLAPEQVCDRFRQAWETPSGASRMRGLVYRRLYDAVEAIPALEGDRKNASLELAPEGIWQDEQNCLVPFRKHFRLLSQHRVFDGDFHLRKHGRRWLIYDIYYYPEINRTEVPVAISVAYPSLKDLTGSLEGLARANPQHLAGDLPALTSSDGDKRSGSFTLGEWWDRGLATVDSGVKVISLFTGPSKDRTPAPAAGPSRTGGGSPGRKLVRPWKPGSPR
jgi:hypothetical protein